MIKKIISRGEKYFFRNHNLLCAKEVKKGCVNLDFWDKKDNVGDYIANIVYIWMLSQKKLTENSNAHKTVKLLTIGSIIGLKQYDAVIWGSGIHALSSVIQIFNWRNIVHYDVRALRGPITMQILSFSGYDCSNAILGDPAILMPLIYKPDTIKKRYKISIITHLIHDIVDEEILTSDLNIINVATKDYEKFIEEIVSSERIISSSLHGIILAESYGIPAIFLNRRGCMDTEIMKFYDWYYSTDRYSVKIARTIKEAVSMGSMPLPKLDIMQQNLIKSFPYDLWY